MKEEKSVEKALLQLLESNPNDWSIRLLIAEKFYLRGADDEITALLSNAPGPPGSAPELEKVIQYAGNGSLDIVTAYVAEHPADGYGHHSLAYLLENLGEDSKAGNHYEVARALGFSDEQVEDSPSESGGQADYPQESGQSVLPSNAVPSPANVGQPLPAGDPEETDEPKRQTGSKITAVLVTIAVHVIIALIATLLVIIPSSEDEPEIVAALIGPPPAKPEMKKKRVATQVKKSTSSAAAAAPLAVLMRANASAKISLPEVKHTSIGPLGMGESDFGAGALGIGDESGNAADGETLFGSSRVGSVQGYLYDIKRDGEGNPRRITGMEDIWQGYRDIMPHLHELIRSDFSESALSDHTRVGRPLSFSFLAIPKMDAKIGPEAFGAKGEMKPSGWLAIYRGRVGVGDGGFGTEIRLVGRFDDVLLVFHNGELVLDGSYDIEKGAPTATKFRPTGEIPKDRQYFRQPARIGPWFRLGKGDELVIVVGEIPGGALGGGLFCQEKGVNYKNGKFAPFVIGKLSEENKKRLKTVPGCTLEKIPKFF